MSRLLQRSVPGGQPRMEYREFLEHLSETPREWYLSRNRIRFNSGEGKIDCPLTKEARDLLGEEFLDHEWQEAAKALGVKNAVGDRIMRAADASTVFPLIFHPRIWLTRRDLLRATGLIGKARSSHRNIGPIESPVKPLHPADRELQELWANRGQALKQPEAVLSK